MNENIDLTKILKDCPKGTKFYSYIFGEETRFKGVSHHKGNPVPVSIYGKYGEDQEFCLSRKGHPHGDDYGECCIFPSKEQRDWSKFTAPWYKKLIEHKFHVGQYVTDGYVGGQITSIEDNYHCYKILDFMGGIDTTIPFTLQDNYHLWTIQDAKGGDVLCCKSGWMCIFKAIDNHTNTFSSYCSMSSDKYFFSNGSENHTLDKNFIKAYNGDIYPATKEQRDALMKAMNEAGYEWDVEKKELKKLVPNRFDPKTLQPFDKVLVRNDRREIWRCDFSANGSYDDVEYPYVVINESVMYCIPYNDDTKHLVGTTEEAPEYYRYWED